MSFTESNTVEQILAIPQRSYGLRVVKQIYEPRSGNNEPDRFETLRLGSLTDKPDANSPIIYFRFISEQPLVSNWMDLFRNGKVQDSSLKLFYIGEGATTERLYSGFITTGRYDWLSKNSYHNKPIVTVFWSLIDISCTAKVNLDFCGLGKGQSRRALVENHLIRTVVERGCKLENKDTKLLCRNHLISGASVMG